MDKLDILNQYKVPISLDKHVGIEIEFVSPFERDHIAGLIVKLDLQNNCTLKEDASIDDYLPSRRKGHKPLQLLHICESDDFDYYCHSCPACSQEDDRDSIGQGHEITILTTEKELRVILNKVNVLLKKARAEINDSCGLHVHLDMRQRNFKKSVGMLLSSQSEMRKMVSKERLNNTYCRPLSKKESNKLYGERYRDINVTAYSKFRTIEIRLHEGTVNTAEIYNWTRYLIATVDKKKVSKTYVKRRFAQCS